MTRFFNINTLLAFVTVAREGSVSRAAELLNLTQPAVSQQLRRLSEEVGLPLFEREAAGLRLTPDGAALLPKAEQVIEAMGAFRQAACQRSDVVTGTLKIGTIIDPEFIRLGQLLGRMRTEFPGIETELAHGISGEIMARLTRGQIDAGFVLGPPEAEAGADQDEAVHLMPLAGFSYRVVAPSGWQAQVEEADWPELARLPWIGTPEQSAHHQLLQRIFGARGLEQNVVALVDQEASMMEMVRSGVGLSLCRDAIALYQKQSYGVALAGRVAVPACLYLAVQRRHLESPVMAALLDLMRGIWGQPRP
ncbi:LysR family transcriptional regulator [Roseovarius sp. C7]|uniref:LysR family transcriptional regulator n=1 Tax=Roseovarius sp. C7 TaxID=3398643 RepID=UPI0039F7047A